jgi:hypothetical protein
MKKIPTLFVRDPEDRRYVTSEVSPGCEWVAEGSGTPRRKYDGTCVMLDEHGNWWARREVKSGKIPPPNYVTAQYDTATGKTVGWEPIGQSAFAKYHAEAVENVESIGDDERDIPWTPGTFELIGPKINGNPEKLAGHDLIRHSTAEVFAFTDRSFAELRRILLFLAESYGYEGVVFHHEDGVRFAKLKAKDLRR